MISGAHVVLFSTDPEAVRTFCRDVLELESVDAGGGWLIFALPPAEVGVHPVDAEPHHELYLMCADLEATMQRISERGGTFTGPPQEARFGRVVSLHLPDGTELRMYQPRHTTAIATT